MKSFKRWNGSNPVGESQVNALERVDAPFLTAIGPDYQTYKKDGSYEMYGGGHAPFLWGSYLLDDGNVYFAYADVREPYAQVSIPRALYQIGGAYVDAQALKVFVGDNCVLHLIANAVDTGLDTTVFWVAATRADRFGSEFLPAQAGHERQSISYVGDAQIHGFPRFLTNFSLFATGWHDDTRRYRFGFTAMSYTDAAHKEMTLRGACFVASTGAYAMTQSTTMVLPDRVHTRYNTGVIGPGKLQYLQCVQEEFVSGSTTTWKTQIHPFLCTSADHGDTWSFAYVSFLDASLILRAAGSTSRAFYDNLQLTAMTQYALMTYIGEGQQLLIVPNAWVDGSEDLFTARYAAAAFIGDGSTGFTRLTWPADTWYVRRDGITRIGATPVLPLVTMGEMRGAHYAFGAGCFFIPVADAGGWRAMLTHDFGATWSFSDYVPVDMAMPGDIGFAGTVVRPYESEAKPGLILFAAPDYATGKLRFYSADGTFGEFKRAGTWPIKSALAAAVGGVQNCHFVNYGGSVYPAFPGEFDAP